MYHIGGRTYALIHDHKNGWNPEAFRDRYSEVLERYDYVIGDWGYNQLRLKGFFRDNHPKVSRDSAISGMVDYINEYCNFGCAYFVLEKQPGGKRSEDGDGEDIDLDALTPAEQPELTLEPAESAAQRAASSAGETGMQQAAPAAEEKAEQLRPRHQREGRRDFGRNSRREERDSQAGRKPFAKDNPGKEQRDREGGARHRQHNGTQSAAQQNDRFERSGQQAQGQDRPQRPKKLPFSTPKAPVAAAAEHPAQPNSHSRQNGGGTPNGAPRNNR